MHNLPSLGVHSDTHGKLLVDLLIEKFPHSLCLVISREFDEKLWDLENMLKYFKGCASLVNEKPYNPNKCNENTMSEFYQDSKNCVVSIAKENFSQQNVIR